MDDVTSGFDARIARSISTQLFDRDGHFRKAGISVILATHNRMLIDPCPQKSTNISQGQILSQMDSVVVLDKGRVFDSGSLEGVRSRNASLFRRIEVSTEPSSTESINGIEAAAQNEDENERRVSPKLFPEAIPADKTLNRRSGSWFVYGYYCKSAGNLPLIFWGFFTIIGAIATNYARKYA